MQRENPKMVKDRKVIMNKEIKKGTTLYYARISHNLGMYELCELKVRSAYDTYFVALENRTKIAFLFGYNLIGETVFFNRKEALEKVREAEKDKPKNISTETYYEEY